MPVNFTDFGPFNNVWKLNQENWPKFFRHFISDGVIKGSSDEMQVYGDSSGLLVKVKKGECFVHTHRGDNLTQEAILPLGAADQTYSRIDLVVARAVYDIPGQSIMCLDVVKGTPSATPSAPTPTQTAGTIWEIPLAQVLICPRANTINAGDVTDKRVFCALSIRMGGTGSVTAATALNAILGGSLVPIDRGGTNANNATTARNNLGVTAIINEINGRIQNIINDIAGRFNAASGHNHDGANSRRIAMTSITGYGNAAVRNVGSTTVTFNGITPGGTATVGVSGLPAGALVWIEPTDASWQACQIAGVRYYSHTANSLTVKAVTNPGTISLVVGWLG